MTGDSPPSSGTVRTPPGTARDQERVETRTVTLWRGGTAMRGQRCLAEETPIAISYNGRSHAVMMATPSDLEDFACGFTLTEGIISAPSEIEAVEANTTEKGIDLHITLAPEAGKRLIHRHRAMAGPVGCGLCGVESLDLAIRPLPMLPAGQRIRADTIDRLLALLPPLQALNHLTRAVHAAAYMPLDGTTPILREDVGRHNALDKLAGALAGAGIAANGLVVVTSRLSLEMIQKAAMMAAPILAGISAPTGLASRVAEEIGLTVIAVARADGFEVVTHPRRIVFPVPDSGVTNADVA